MVRLTRLVEDMFLLARADAGGVRLRIKSLYLDEVLREALRAAEVLARRKGVSVVAAPLPEAAFSGDEALIRQLVLILLDNAVKYTPPGGTVDVTMKARPDAFEILVSDTGAGIPLEAQPRLFERFFRVDSSRSRSGNGGGGAGLGLSIAHWIAEAHHGEVALRTSSERGSTFAIVLPKTPSGPAQAKN
jgi:signal transduction histidine kinase